MWWSIWAVGDVENDVIDPSVGIDHVLPLGTAVGRGDAIARVHANRLDRAQAAVKAWKISF